jgi:hypothetical protein
VADAMPRPPTKAPPLVAFAGFLLLGTIGAVAMASALGSRSAERAAPSASTRAAASLVQNAAPVDPGTGDPPPIGEPTTTVPSTSAATEMIPTPLATAAVRVDGGIARDKNKGSRNKRPIDDGDPYRR